MIIWFKKVSKLPVKKCWKGYLMCLEAHWKVFYCCYDSLAQWLLTSQHNWLQLNSRSSQTVPGITLFTIWTRSLKFVNKNNIQNYFSYLWIFVNVCSPARSMTFRRNSPKKCFLKFMSPIHTCVSIRRRGVYLFNQNLDWLQYAEGCVRRQCHSSRS